LDDAVASLQASLSKDEIAVLGASYTPLRVMASFDYKNILFSCSTLDIDKVPATNAFAKQVAGTIVSRSKFDEKLITVKIHTIRKSFLYGFRAYCYEGHENTLGGRQ